MKRTIPRRNRLGKALAFTVLGCLAARGKTWAHAFIDHTAPVVGSTVQAAPAEVKLWYTQGLEPKFSRVQVFDAAGKEVDKKDMHLDPRDNHQMIVSLDPGLGAGKYKVVWRVVSVDTHVTEGSFAFVVAP